MFLMACGAIRNAFRHRHGIVVIFALIVTLMAILVAHGLGRGIGTDESNERLPGRAVARLAIILKMPVADGDRLRQEDCVIATRQENCDE